MKIFQKIFLDENISPQLSALQLNLLQLQTNVHQTNNMGIKMSKTAQPNPADVIEAVKNLPTRGILRQDGYSIYLDLQDDWIFKCMEVLEEFGYFVCRNHLRDSLGAFIMISLDYELVGEREGKIPGLLGKIVDFKVVDAEPITINEVTWYVIKVESPELNKIRKDLTGLPPPTDLGFCITVCPQCPTTTHLACGCPTTCDDCRRIIEEDEYE